MYILYLNVNSKREISVFFRSNSLNIMYIVFLMFIKSDSRVQNDFFEMCTVLMSQYSKVMMHYTIYVCCSSGEKKLVLIHSNVLREVLRELGNLIFFSDIT